MKLAQKKTFLVALIVVSVSMIIISVSRAADQFFAEPSHLETEHMEIDDMVYPPLKACLIDWIYWVNWTSAQEKNFTKAEILYALSFLQKVYSEEDFDVNQVEQSFFQKIKIQNITFIEQFYESIAMTRKNVMRNLKGYSIDYSLSIENLATSPSLSPKYAMCYKFSGEQIKRNIQQMVSRSNLPFDGIIFTLFYTKFWASKSERAWLSEKEVKKAKVGYYPMWITFNGFNKNGLYLSNDARYVTINSEVRHWKSHPEYPCQDGQDWIEGNTTCPDECQQKFYFREKEGELKREYTQKIFVSGKNTGIFFDDPENKTKTIKVEKSFYLFNYFSSKNNNSGIPNKVENDETIQNLYDKCIESCNGETGCRVWSYDVGLSELPYFASPNRSLMLIYQPNVEAMKEVSQQTWKGFIGSMGGLLGIWIGASIITFLQIIYLLCCQENRKLVDDMCEN